MDDGIAYVRRLTGEFEETAARLGTGVRRWEEAADAGRATWDDGAGRDVFQRYVDPHRNLLASATQHVSAAVEGHRAALEQAVQAGVEAQRAAALAAEAGSAMQRAREQAGAARAEASTARGESGRALAMARSVEGRLAGLGA